MTNRAVKFIGWFALAALFLVLTSFASMLLIMSVLKDMAIWPYQLCPIVGMIVSAYCTAVCLMRSLE